MTETSPLPPAGPGRCAPRAFIVLLLALLLGACATAPPEPAVVDRAERVAEAERRIEQGRPLAAVRIFRELAESGDAEQRQRWRLRIVELLFDEGYPELALDYHGQLDAEPVPPALETRKRVVDAQAAVARRQGVRALRLLPEATPDLPLEVRARILEARADAHALTGQPARALEVRVRRDELLEDPDAVRANDERTWELLQTIQMEQLQRLQALEEAPVLAGWAELALSVRRARLGERPVTEALAAWRDRFPRHPAVDRFVPTLRDRIVAQLRYPETIALLLPLSGRYAAPAGAVRDGLLTAYYNQPPYIARPELMIIDTGEEGQSALAAYQRAVAAGVGYVIGPLDKESVSDLAGREELPVPLLTLNYLPDAEAEAPAGMVQFGLLPEDEARQAAEAAIQNGHYNGLTLVPAGDWGTRMFEAFRARYEELGGVLIESGRYNPRATDHGRHIRALFDLDQSYLRRRQVQRIIGESVRFEPRRRQDVDMIFVAANPEQARLIEPQLEFHRAADLPVYATSNVFTGVPDPKADWDMNGLFFTEIPWILDNLENPGELYRQVARSWPDRHARFPRLYALGIDALSIVPHLERLRVDPTSGFNGRTGRLRIDERGRIHRQLQWALFEEGRPVPVVHPASRTPTDEDGGVGDDVRDRVNGG
ncbi:MAG: penicillin-binding protein activator [Halofilum sp. (in: g-proteobacteria)]|nr:penicillin-binding protein activator [Halofilum sp. (in: g-proteobacteria)]